MAFQFEKASCVVLGAFNMYILHPQWLAEHEVIERGTEVRIESNLMRPGYRYHFPKQNSIWSIAPDRIVVESWHPQVECGSMVAKVLESLPETPVFGIGNNATYRAERKELDALASRIRDFPLPETPPEGHRVAGYTFHFAVERHIDDIINLQLAVKDDVLELSCNAHRKLENHASANRNAITAALQFFLDRIESKKLALRIFGVTLTHDINDAGAGKFQN